MPGGIATSVTRVSEGVYDVFSSYRAPGDTNAFAGRPAETDRMMMQGLVQRAAQTAAESKASAFHASRPRSFVRTVERRTASFSAPTAKDYYARMRIILPGAGRAPEPGMVLLDTAKAGAFTFERLEPEPAPGGTKSSS